MNANNISFSSKAPRLSFMDWYDLTGPDGTIEREKLPRKDYISGEFDAYKKMQTQDSNYQFDVLHKKKFTAKPSYGYDDYLRLRIAFAHEDVPQNELAMAKLRFCKEPAYCDEPLFISGQLDGEQKYLGFTLADSTNLMLFTSGWIVFGTLSGDQDIKIGDNTLPCKGQSQITGHPNRTIKSIRIRETVTLRWSDKDGGRHNALAEPDTDVFFNDNGIPYKVYTKIKTDSGDHYSYIYINSDGFVLDLDGQAIK